MNKELENIKYIRNSLMERLEIDITEFDDVLLELDELEQSLTPPTQEEVCKALNKEFDVDDFTFINWEFWSEKADTGCEFDLRYTNKILWFEEPIKFSTHKMVLDFYDKFYEGMK